ncbi:MAG: diaminopropionate ammonia-lyase [Bacteroidales bacterium]|nr:diaminopropionate ammonia-lyase [Bacteroidales bacterium]
MNNSTALQWIANNYATATANRKLLDTLFPADVAAEAQKFHRQIPGFEATPLRRLSALAAKTGVKEILVKDESLRLGLNAFKVLGGSYAIYKRLQQIHAKGQQLAFDEMRSSNLYADGEPQVFVAATDGNHGIGVAWAARELGYKAIIYVHQLTSGARIEAIARQGARVVVVPGTYDDAVREAGADAEKNGWQVISDTSWEGYEEIPAWVMQGYTTMLAEAQQQMKAMAISKPTHVFVQGGVGALAAATVGYFKQLYYDNPPRFVVTEPEAAACLYSSCRIADGKPHSFPGDLDTIMAGLACGDPSPLAWNILRDYADVFITCPDYVAARGMRVYGAPAGADPRVISGESGAVTLGALLTITEPKYAALRQKIGLDKNAQVLLINTEGDTDPQDYLKIVWDGRFPLPENQERI